MQSWNALFHTLLPRGTEEKPDRLINRWRPAPLCSVRYQLMALQDPLVACLYLRHHFSDNTLDGGQRLHEQGSGLGKPSESVSYNQWLKEVSRVSLEKRTRRHTVATFRCTKDVIIPEKAEPKRASYTESDLGSELALPHTEISGSVWNSEPLFHLLLLE